MWDGESVSAVYTVVVPVLVVYMLELPVLAYILELSLQGVSVSGLAVSV